MRSIDMSIHNLDKFFKPESVAIIGASERRESIGNSLVKNILKSGYQGKVFQVNPRHTFIHGHPSYPSISNINEPVDLAIMATPIANGPSIIKGCVKAAVGGLIIISAGGKGFLAVLSG